MPGMAAVQDGVATPAPVADLAQIYVDAADGDLQIKVGDDTGRCSLMPLVIA